jgi:hypothetical protein
MPQYDADEDTVPTIPPSSPVADYIPSQSHLETAVVNKPLTTCYGEGINKVSDTDTPEMDENPHSPSHHFTRRHSLLCQQESLMENQIESFDIPAPSTSPKSLSLAEGDQVTKCERPQQQEDDVMMNAKKTANEQEGQQ